MKRIFSFLSIELQLTLLLLAFDFVPALSQPCSPISTLTCPAVVKTLPVTINFTSGEGGLKDRSGLSTGFTMVDKPSAPLVTPTYANIPGYEPARLQISAGKLIITTTAGIRHLNPVKLKTACALICYLHTLRLPIAGKILPHYLNPGIRALLAL
jgi:hypothetical protein